MLLTLPNKRVFYSVHDVTEQLAARAVEDPQVANFIDHYERERKVLRPLEILVAEDGDLSALTRLRQRGFDVRLGAVTGGRKAYRLATAA